MHLLASGKQTLLESARRHLIEIPRTDARPGDVLVFRWRSSTIAKHAGVMAHPLTMIHAMEGAPVCEIALSRYAAAAGDKLESIDINPFAVMPKGKGAMALDAVLVVKA